MPEGPEIRIAADRLETALVGSPVAYIYFQLDRLKRFQTELAGSQVRRIETRGKALLAHFDCDLTIYSHNQLYGRWLVHKAHDIPKTARQLRLAIHTESKSALLYSATDIEVLTPKQIASHRYLTALGPDILADGIERVRAQLLSPVYQRRRLASLFLDQRFLAGVGNYLRSEILFVAGLNPRLRPLDCSTSILGCLADAAVAVSRQSYLHRGVTNDLADAAVLKARGQTRSQYRHWVFARGGKPCRRCGPGVVEETTSGRRINHCPACQPAPAGSA